MLDETDYKKLSQKEEKIAYIILVTGIVVTIAMLAFMAIKTFCTK